MTDLKSTIALTNANMETLSRREILEWVNTTVNGNYAKIEELCSGVAYCQMMEQLHPNCVGLKKIKTAAKLDHEHLHNLRLLQTAFTRLKFEKTVPIDRLMKGRFQDNFEFLQWFKKFYDANCIATGKENIPNSNAKSKLGAKTLSNPKLNVKDQKFLKTPANDQSVQRCVSPPTTRVLQDNVDILKAQLGDVKADRDYYFKKLTTVEMLLKRAMERGEDENFCKRALQILYAGQPDNPEDLK